MPQLLETPTATNQLQPLVLYHDNCNDGLTAAWCVMDAYRSIGVAVDLLGVRYGRPPPPVLGRHVIMVDFSYDRPVLLEMLEKAERIEIYDHHKTAKEQLEGLEHEKLLVVFDMDRSGAGIAWDEFHPDPEDAEKALPRPWFVDYVEANDLWKHERYGDCKEVIEYIRSIPQESHFAFFDAFLHHMPPEAVPIGKSLLAHKAVMVRQSVDLAREVELFGEKVWISNVPFFLSSEVANELIRSNRIGITYYQKSDGFYGLSFRSKDGKSAAEFALRCKLLVGAKDGGGHGNSAGATVASLPWEDEQVAQILEAFAPPAVPEPTKTAGWHVHLGTEARSDGRIVSDPSKSRVFDPDGKEISKFWRGIELHQNGESGHVVGKIEVIVTKVTSGLTPPQR